MTQIPFEPWSLPLCAPVLKLCLLLYDTTTALQAGKGKLSLLLYDTAVYNGSAGWEGRETELAMQQRTEHNESQSKHRIAHNMHSHTYQTPKTIDTGIENPL